MVDAELLKPWQLSRETYKQRKRITGSREKSTLERLSAFQSKLSKAQVRSVARTCVCAGGSNDHAPGAQLLDP